MMQFDYFYNKESQSYAFYRTPKFFFTDERFKILSRDARFLYGILLDRVEMSARNNWKDEAGRIYVYMTISSIEESFGVCHQTACKLLKELEEFGLIERKKQGLGKPAVIYVKKCIPVCESHLQKYENHIPGGMKIISTEVCNSYPNKNNKNNTENNNTNLILSDEMRKERACLEKQLSYSALIVNNPGDAESLESLFDLILDVLCTQKERILIEGDYKPADVVKAQFRKLTYEHIEYVLDCLNHCTSKVRNTKQYMLAVLYNAPFTMDGYYRNLVNHNESIGKHHKEKCFSTHGDESHFDVTPGKTYEIAELGKTKECTDTEKSEDKDITSSDLSAI